MVTSVERKGFVKAVTKTLVMAGLLDRHPAETSPGREPRSTGTKALSMTRLTVATAFATAVGAAALVVLSIERSDPAGVVVAVYIAVTGIADAPLVVADIRTRAGLMTANRSATAHGSVKVVTARSGEALVVDAADDMLVIDASGADLRVELPEPSKFRNRELTFERIDQTDHDVVLEPLGRSLGRADAELRLVVADGAWKAFV